MVRTEKNGPVTTVVLSRPERRNAVDRDTAEALFAAFTAFERDDSASVAVLWGEGGTFCAGADLVALIARGAEPPRADRIRPHGTDADGARQARRRRHRRARGGRGPRARALVRPAGRRGGRGVRRVLPPLGGPPHRRRDRAPPADDRPLPRARHDPHGTPRGAREALEWGLANRVVPRGESRAAAESLAADLARFPQRCVRSDRASALEQWSLPADAALAQEFTHGAATIASGETAAGAIRVRRRRRPPRPLRAEASRP